MDGPRTFLHMLTARQQFCRQQSTEDPSVSHSQRQLNIPTAHIYNIMNHSYTHSKRLPFTNINNGASYKILILLTWFLSVRKSTLTAERKTGSGKSTANISNGHSIRTKAGKDRSQYIYGVSQEECARLRESVPYVKL